MPIITALVFLTASLLTTTGPAHARGFPELTATVSATEYLELQNEISAMWTEYKSHRVSCDRFVDLETDVPGAGYFGTTARLPVTEDTLVVDPRSGTATVHVTFKKVTPAVACYQQFENARDQRLNFARIQQIGN